MIYPAIKSILLGLLILSVASCSTLNTQVQKETALNNVKTDGFYEQEDGVKLFFYPKFDQSYYVFIDDPLPLYYPVAEYYFAYDKTSASHTALCIDQYSTANRTHHKNCIALNKNVELPLTFYNLEGRAKLTKSVVESIRKNIQP
jgi:hypothetical protein